MDPWRVHLGPGIDSLAALGVATPDELLEAGGEVVARSGGAETLRFAVPDGGAALLERWMRPALRELLDARLTPPRSESLAEREWNLLCHLRAHGVGVPELLAVGALGRGPVARRSFLVVREPEGMVRLDRWLAMEVAAEHRARGLASVEATLGALTRMGVRLPHLAPEDLWLSAEDAVTDEGSEPDCAAHALADLRADTALGRLRRNRAPGVVVARAWGGRVGAGVEPEILEELRALLTLPDAVRQP